jgi:hypothetical protein
VFVADDPPAPAGPSALDLGALVGGLLERPGWVEVRVCYDQGITVTVARRP